MQIRVFTEKEKQWLIDNYATMKQADCAKHLMVSANVVRRLAKELGIYEKKNLAIEVNKPKARPDILEAGKKYCIECAFYVVGGICGRNGRIIGALHNLKLMTNEKGAYN